jgi:glycerol-1-phosphate dehydrogenase [NAD(P)+]
LLALEGIATSLAHTTAPFSGFEHLISHLLDLLAKHYHQPPTLHGTQVALLTILTTLAYREFINRFDPSHLNLEDCYPSESEMQDRIRRAFDSIDPSGGIAAECWAEYNKKLKSWVANRSTFERFLRDWESIGIDLQRIVRPPELLVEILQRMESPTHFDQLVPPTPEAQVKFAFIHSSFIRNRFTLGDLLILLKWDLDQLWSRIWTESGALAQEATFTASIS